MKVLDIIRCPNCGSEKIKEKKGNVAVCAHCGLSLLVPRNEEIISLLNSAQIYRENHKYDLAIKTYQYAIDKDPNELSAYDGILLSEYGIEYVKDTVSKKYVPTCHRVHNKNIYENPYYKTLYELGDDAQKEIIKNRADEINKLQQAVEKQMEGEEDFEVFISFKATDDKNEKTEDSLIARAIYDELTKKKYKVFFSEKTLENRIGSEYEPIIFKALHTAKVFILVGTQKENIESSWVRNEWARFIERISNREEKLNSSCFIPVFKNMSPYDMPKVNNQFVQGVDASKIGYVYTIVDGVEKILSPESEKEILATFDNIDNMIEFERIRKRRMKEFKAKDWDDLQTSPDRQKEKTLYNMFLCLPYVLLLLSIGLLCYPGTWFRGAMLFYIWVILLIVTVASILLTIFVHIKMYPLKTMFQAVIPSVTLIVLIPVMLVLTYFVPLTSTGKSAIGYSEKYEYCSNYIYYTNFNTDTSDTRTIIALTNKGAKKYETIKDGKKFLDLPCKNGKFAIVYQNLDIADDVYGLILHDQKTFSILEENNVEVVYAYNVEHIYSAKPITIYYEGKKPCYESEITQHTYISLSNKG